jgi:hypothetical protein
VQRAANPLRVNASRKNGGIKEREREEAEEIYTFFSSAEERKVYMDIFLPRSPPHHPFLLFHAGLISQ